MLDKKTTDDLVRFLIETENGFCSTSMTLENIKKCERWISDVTEIAKANVTIIGEFETPAQFNKLVRSNVWREAFKLNSLTPSEAACIYLESQGERDNFDTSQEIFQRKRGEILPEQFSDDPEKPDGRLRAIMLREKVTDRFLRAYSSLDFRNSEKSSEAVKTFLHNGGSKNEWMRLGRGFDIFESRANSVPLLDAQGNEMKDPMGKTVKRPSVHLIAYKTPYGKANYNALKREIPLGEVAKFAYQKMGLEEAGVTIDHCSLAVLNDEIFTARKFEVDGVDEIQADVKEACEKFWSECIKKGHAPQRDRSNNYQDGLHKALAERNGNADDAIIRIHKASYKHAAASLMKNMADKLITEAKSELIVAGLRAGIGIDDVLEETKTGDLKGKTRLGLVDVSRTHKRKLDDKGLLEEFRARGGEESAVTNDQGSIDVVQLKEMSQAMGVNIMSFMKTKIEDRFTLNSSQNSEFFPIKTQIEEIVGQTMDDLIEEMNDMISENYGEMPEATPPKITEPVAEVDSKSNKLEKDLDFGW